MPRMTVCSAPGCPELVPVRVGRCDEHARPAWQNQSRHTKERPSDWYKIRARVLRRDGKTCVICGSPGTDVDHIIRVADGGSWSQENLRTLCKSCHATKTRAEKRSR